MSPRSAFRHKSDFVPKLPRIGPNQAVSGRGLNNRRLFEAHGHSPPAEYEAAHCGYREKAQTARARLKLRSLHETRGGSV